MKTRGKVLAGMSLIIVVCAVVLVIQRLGLTSMVGRITTRSVIHKDILPPSLFISMRNATEDTNDKICSHGIRKACLKDVCDRRHWRRGVKTSAKSKFWRLLADDRHELLYCVIPKVACTTFKSQMVAMTGQRAADPQPLVHQVSVLKRLGLRYLDQFSTADRERRLANYAKFIIVRHPFDRLLSAYTDKIVHNYGYTERFRQQILRHFNLSEIHRDEADKMRISFEQFLKLIAKEYNTGFYDRHWASYYDLCHPCDIVYDYILKLETIDRDRWDFLEGLGERRSNDVTMDHLNAIRSQKDKMRNVTESFPRLDEDVLASLMAIYKADFELFGYGFSESGGATCDRTMDAGRSCC